MRINRSEFIQQLEGKRVSLDKVNDDPTLTNSQKSRLRRADLNRDGFIEGAREAERLFTEMDHYDRNGSRGSIETTSSGSIARVADAVRGAIEVPTSRPSADGSPLGRLLAANPSLETNQDLLNLFLRRNRNNWNAAAADARRVGVDINDLVSNRDGLIDPTRANPTGDTGDVGNVGDVRPPNSSDVARLSRVRGADNTTLTFRQKVVQVAERLRMDPVHLMAVMSFETGESFSPSVRNRSTGATGLIQFMPSTARGMGTSTSSLSRMTPERQLDYVERYLQPYAGKMNTVEDAYMAVLWPAAVGDGPNRALFRNPTRAYRQNRGLDINRNGVVTAREAASKVRAKIR